MWIRTQDKTTLLNMVTVKLIRGMVKNEKGLIFAQYAGKSLFHENGQIVAKYATYEEAETAFTKLEKAIASGNKTVYQME